MHMVRRQCQIILFKANVLNGWEPELIVIPQRVKAIMLVIKVVQYITSRLQRKAQQTKQSIRWKQNIWYIISLNYNLSMSHQILLHFHNPRKACCLFLVAYLLGLSSILKMMAPCSSKISLNAVLFTQSLIHTPKEINEIIFQLLRKVDHMHQHLLKL